MIWDNKTAFFQIQLPKTKSIAMGSDFTNLIRPQDVKSLTITEQFGQITNGSLSLRDPDCVYSRIIPRGAYVAISWGYKRWDQELDFLDPGLDLARQGIVRRGFIGLIQAPTGGGDDRGETIYNASFVMAAARGEKRNLTFEGGTKTQAVRTVMTNMGIVSAEINFERGNEVFDGGGYEMQYESDFKTLSRWAGEWRAMFRIGHLSDGTLTAVFINPYSIFTSPTLRAMSQTQIDSPVRLVYRATKDKLTKPNVISYNWQHQDGVNGAGDGTVVYLAPDGTVKYQAYHVANEDVTAWKLNPDKVQKYLEGDLGTQYGSTMAERVQRFLAAGTFSENVVKQVFDPIDLKTAPNGIGYSVTAKLLGMPYVTPGLTAEFYGTGFPDFLTTPQGGNSLFFYYDRTVHTLSSAGYFTEVEIVDTYSQSPTGTSLVAAGG